MDDRRHYTSNAYKLGPAVIVGGAISIAAIIYTWAIVAHLLT